MGQGFSLATPYAGAAGIETPQLSDIQYETSIGNARLMKSVRGRHENGVVLVKVLVKPYPDVKLEKYKTNIVKQRKALADVPNALGFQRIVETETNGYLVRQFLYSSLYDRLSTRPFLEDIEKKWLAFQLLHALKDCHARDVYHGDIKAQNVLVTSWNWLYLTDFSSAYKPVMLPDDNPGDFSFFFDTSGRRTCYIAPERFYASGEEPPERSKMTWAMDIFSAGCVIAQMFLESEIFSLAQLYKYRRGEYDPVITHLGVISDKEVRDMISHMIQLDPEKRYSAEQYLTFWKGKVFPHYFYTFLHEYMGVITDASSSSGTGPSGARNFGESDDRIDRVYLDFDKISYFLGYQPEKRISSAMRAYPRLGLGHFPVKLGIPNHEHRVSADSEPPEDDGSLLFLTLIVSSIRTTARAMSRIRACDILLAFSERLTDEAKLDRVLPYLVALLKREETDTVIISAIRTITQLLQLVKMVTPINSHVMVEYVLPRMEVALSTKSKPASTLVRATYASCLGSLASTARRFLETSASLISDGSITVADPEIEPGTDAEANFESAFDNAAQQLFEVLESHTKQLVEDPEVQVRRAFLASVPELCMFFQEHSNDILLTHLNTYLNDRDWMLKCAFFDTIVGIATFIGSTTLEEFMLPIMVQSLMDTEEHVVQSTLHSLAQLASLGLLSRSKVWELSDLISRFTMHPNLWIREAAAEFLAMSVKYLEFADVRCIFMPLARPYLKVATLVDLSELSILDSLKKPLSRAVFEQAITWAMKADRGIFWKSLQQVRSLTFGGGITARSSKELTTNSMGKLARNDEDEQWLAKLKNLGLKHDDEVKLVALREFIWRLSKTKFRTDSIVNETGHTGLIHLKDLGLTPQTVFFNEVSAGEKSLPEEIPQAQARFTIEDALLDASMTIDDSVQKRRRGVLGHKARVSSVGPRIPPSERLLSPAANLRRSASFAPEASDDATVGEGPLSTRIAMRSQSSALSLLNRDGQKSLAETGTSDANAFGQVEGPFMQTAEATPSTQTTGTGAIPKREGAKHSYEGTDPHIQRMLDDMFIDNFPRDVVEFGPMVQPIQRNKARSSSASQEEPWRPQGNLVATFGEHQGAIRKIAVSPDHVFFITGGDDGAVKVWDTARLERNITHRSRQTHKHAEGARVISLCFIENTHCFVSCASDGAVHVVKVDTVSASDVMRYGKLRILREYMLPADEFAVWCEHFKHENNSVLLLATNRSRILGIDLRTMTLLYVLENPVQHGTPTCFCVDKKRNWLCVGTSHGVIDLWDLRFRMRLKGWGMPGRSSIYRLCIHPTKGRGKWICVSGGTGLGEITVWDLEKTTCREIYRTGGHKDGPKTYEAWDVDEDRADRMLGRFATSLEATENAQSDRGIRAVVVGVGVADDPRDVRHAYILTGGSDRRLRFWDIARPELSCIYSGLHPDEPKPAYATVHPTTAVALVAERFPRHAPTANNASSGPSSGRSRGTSSRPSRSSVISTGQQLLLQSHLDGVMDMAVLEWPYGMSVSADRNGVVFVFQ